MKQHTNFLKMLILRPPINRPLILDPCHVHIPGLLDPLFHVMYRLHASAKLITSLDQQPIPLQQRRVLCQRPVVADAGVYGVTDLNPAAGGSVLVGFLE